MSLNKTAHRVIGKGVDPTGQGRWCYSTYRGKNNIKLRVVSLYRCCKPSSPGPSTVYMQQQRIHDAKNDNRDPRNSVLEDLGETLATWTENNDKIMILADMNSDVNCTAINNWCEQHNLREIITKTHQTTNGYSPTYHRGTIPIDGIFISSNISVHKCGYLPFDAFPSDHRAIWIDLQINEIFGSKMCTLHRPAARRLKCGDPRIMKKWKKVYTRFIKQHKLHSRLFAIESACIRQHNNLTPTQIKIYNGLLNLRLQGIKHADKKCRKLMMGGVPYSEEIKNCQKKLVYGMQHLPVNVDANTAHKKCDV